jgi:uncharacterized glyoxalase superfamily protein PhnB
MAKETGTRVIPTIRYRDAGAAIEWLCRAFGFERHFVVPGGAGAIVHAQLSFGNGMIMLGTARDDAFGQQVKAPSRSEPGTQCAWSGWRLSGTGRRFRSNA